MLVASSPTKFSYAWGYGQSAPYIRVINQTTSTPGQASFEFGYPEITFIPTGGGGIPPDGADENGILNQITLWLQWYNGGGPIFYDPTWSAANGGYPKWAMLSNATTPGLFWISTADSNTSNPDAGGANWQVFPSFQTQAAASDIWAGTSQTLIVTPYALAQASGQQTLTDAATIAWPMGLSQDAVVTLTSGVGSARAFGAPTGFVPGRSFSLAIIQPSSGDGYTISSWASIWDWMLPGPPTLSTGASKRDLITGKHDQATNKLVASFLQSA